MFEGGSFDRAPSSPYLCVYAFLIHAASGGGSFDRVPSSPCLRVYAFLTHALMPRSEEIPSFACVPFFMHFVSCKSCIACVSLLYLSILFHARVTSTTCLCYLYAPWVMIGQGLVPPLQGFRGRDTRLEGWLALKWVCHDFLGCRST